MDKVLISGSMAQNILENGLMIRWTVRVPLSGLIIECMLVHGNWVNSMGTQFTGLLLERIGEATGKME